jgi:hypothetical protein
MVGAPNLRKKIRVPSGKRNFAWLAVWIVLIGGAATLLLHVTRMDPDATGPARIAMMVTIVLAGLCGIIASAE